MKRLFTSLLACSLLFVSFRTGTPDLSFVKDNFRFADAQLRQMVKLADAKPLAFPRSIDGKGQLVTTDMYDWTPGFFAGSLWYTYAYTKDTTLKTAAINWYLRNPNLPADKVPYWDFNAGQPGYTPGVQSHAPTNNANKPRDASAAAITASALLELSTYDTKNRTLFFDGAVKILQSLAGPAYRTPATAQTPFLLQHSVGSLAHGFEIDVPIIYADYYFVEALYRYNQLL